MMLTVQGQPAYAYTGGRPFDPALPCVVFVHGASHDHTVWTLLSRWCAHHGFGVLAVDLPGHRRSAGPLLPDVESLGAWVLALLDAAGVRRATLVGHSMGSLITLEAAAQAPERAERLVMVGTSYPMVVSEALRSAATRDPAEAMAMVNVWSISSLATKPGFPSPGHWLHGGCLTLMHRVQADAPPGTNLFLHDFDTCHRYARGLDAAQAVTCPVHFILGRHDQMTPTKASHSLAHALKATVHTVQSGHHQMAEDPDATLAALRAALR